MLFYTNNSFDESSLDELTFDEFCQIYNNIGWFASRVMSGIKESAAAYKRFLRKKLLQRLSTIPVYTVYASVDNLPFVLQDGSMLLYTEKEPAVLQIENAGLDWLELHEIAPEEFESQFCEYRVTGYASVAVNGKTVVKIEDISHTKPIDSLGIICMEACTRMVDYKQSYAMVISAAKKENRSLRQEEITVLNKQSWGVSQSLLKCRLLVPAETENGVLKGFSIPNVLFPDGTKCLGLFTDQWAINGYYRKSVSCVSLPALIKDNYEMIADDPSVSGILINPGREEYKLTKEMLAQLFSDAE